MNWCWVQHGALIQDIKRIMNYELELGEALYFNTRYQTNYE